EDGIRDFHVTGVQTCALPISCQIWLNAIILLCFTLKGKIMRAYNFCAGPAALPTAVLEKAQAEMLDWHGKGLSIMEMSHRSADYVAMRSEERRVGKEGRTRGERD